MRLGVLQAMILLGWMICSSSIESHKVVKLRGSEGCILFPIIFSGTNAIALPTTRLKDVRRGGDEEMYVKEFIGCIGDMVLSFTAFDICCEGDGVFEAVFVREMKKHLQKVSNDALSVYARGKSTLSEVLLMVYDRLFECDVRDEGKRRMTVFGKCLISEADRMIREIGDDVDEKEREERENFCNVIKKRGEKCCNLKMWKRIVYAESVVCNASVSLYNKLPEEELLGLLAEGCMRKDFKEEGVSEEELNDRGYMEYSIVDTKLVLDTYVKHGCEVVEEIVRQMMLGKDGREIDAKYVEKVVRVVDEKRRRREIEASRHAAELLGEELSDKKSKGKAKGKKSKRKSGGADRKGPAVSKEEERADKASESPDEELAGAVGGVSIEDHRPKRSDKRYRIHKRVSVWMRDASSIKRALDGGREEKWKGKSIEDIERQKITHDIIEVVRLLESCDADLFFMDARTSVKDGVERSRRVAVGVLEVSGERRVGVVEAVSFKDKDGQDVIYHLMFRETVAQEIGGVMSQGISPESEMAGDSSVECSGSDGVFEYAPGTRCEVSQDTHRFVVTWKNPRDTSEVLKRLTVVCRPETI
ncbi:putative immunoglobulin G-binding protein A [Encephalitozoon hellem]|uniref:Immunoglobulin G-binding protein A n=2 Tax=Encephalitozoon hellem TaxID=27973 RepID=A0ABY8CSM1_ENCHE|nr:putative immunoglobulin G-binding protein A [Encephalitozoon hellem]